MDHDYENDNVRADDDRADRGEHTQTTAVNDDAHYVGGVSSRPYVDRVYEPVRSAGGGNASAEYTAYNAAAQPPQKPNKQRGRGTVSALVLVLCMVMSVLLGFGGGVLANSHVFGNAPVVSQSPQTTQQQPQNESKPAQSPVQMPEGVERKTENVQTVSALVDAVADSVVEISTEYVATSQYMQQYITEGAGSGVIINADGTIVTCHHVINNANKISVRLRNGEVYEAQVVAADDASDVAVLKIEAQNLTAAPMGDSDVLKVGEDAIVIGNPLGALGGSVTNGIISALEREITLDNEKMVLLQTNAAINPGNSGGGLFDGYGNLVGIVVAKSAGSKVEGLGFAIPINTVKEVYEQLINNGYVTGRAALGVVMTEQKAISFNGNESRAYVIVTDVLEDSPAKSAGIEAGDIILSIDDQEVTSASVLKSYIRDCSVGDTVQIVLLRGNNTMTVNATLMESRPTE